MYDQDRIADLEGKLSQLQAKDRAEQEGAEKQKVVNAVRKSQYAIDAAEKALSEAFDEGDGETIAKAQRVLAERAAAHERLKAEVEQVVNAKGWNRGGGGGDGDLDTQNLDNWKSQHSSWYGIVDCIREISWIRYCDDMQCWPRPEVPSVDLDTALDAECLRRFHRDYLAELGNAYGVKISNQLSHLAKDVRKVTADMEELWSFAKARRAGRIGEKVQS